MTETDNAFTGSIPEFYDTYLTPLIFEVYANDIAERVAAITPQKVLETAAGSGVVTRTLAPRLASGLLHCDRPQPADARSRRRPAGIGLPDYLASGRRSESALR